MTSRRSEIEILATILEAAKSGGILASELLLKANLSTARLKQYMDLLVEEGHLVRIKDESRNRQTYKITGKGRQLLCMLIRLKQMTEELESEGSPTKMTKGKVP